MNHCYWVAKNSNSADYNTCCYEVLGDFCQVCLPYVPDGLLIIVTVSAKL